MNLIVSQEEMGHLVLTGGAGVKAMCGVRREDEQLGQAWLRVLACASYLQLIEVICAVFPCQTLHNARYW